MLFDKNDVIDKYTVVFPIKSSFYAETYRVALLGGMQLGFLKLIRKESLRKDQMDSNGRIKEIVFLKAVNHHNICRFVDSGEIEVAGSEYSYFVTEFVSSETLTERMSRVQFKVRDVKTISVAVLKALNQLHTNTRAILHNDVTADNVLYDLMGRPTDVRLIDFGSASYASEQLELPDIESTDPFYMAPERLEGHCSVESDLFSVGVLIYHMIFGRRPWEINLSDVEVENRCKLINVVRQRPLLLPNHGIYDFDEQLMNTMMKALQPKAENRFHSARDFIDAIEHRTVVKRQDIDVTHKPLPKARSSDSDSSQKIRLGNGFADVAGMDELKEQLQSDVINLLKDQERAKGLGLHIPNGLLFYGPPGCGKTFFAEKFAEQMKCNYMYVKCSDVASPYIHGGQEKIAAIFEEARQKAPSIIFLYEIDALVKNRNKQSNVSEAGEVNEFLEQLNNCGHDKVLVIGATNKPREIDEAALRSGKLELKYYIPLPDDATRRQLFQLELSKRKSAENIYVDRLSLLTDNYSCADIKLVVDTAARIVFRNKADEITMDDLLAAIDKIKPSLSTATIQEHLKIKEEFEGHSSGRKPIGFNVTH